MGAQRDHGKLLINCRKKKSARLDKISDLQGVLKDFTVISALYTKISIFGLSWLCLFSVEKVFTNQRVRFLFTFEPLEKIQDFNFLLKTHMK
jgi:hypothetical protein